MFAMLLASALAAPVPKTIAPVYYMPLKEGAKLMRTWNNDGVSQELVERVGKVSEKDGVYTVMIEGGDDKFPGSTTYEVSAAGGIPPPKDEPVGATRPDEEGGGGAGRTHLELLTV